MPDTPDFFREFGILPYGTAAPPEKVRASFSRGTIIGQYIATALMSGFGLGVAVLFVFAFPLPFNLLASLGAVALFGFAVRAATRNDYAWVELDGDFLSGKHLYTGRVVERPVDEIEDILTLVFQIRNETTRLVDAWLGRVRGVEIRFQDKRTPLRVQRTDPAMKNAKELIEAVIYRMEKKAAVEAEIIDLRGKPIVRRIFWKDGPP